MFYSNVKKLSAYIHTLIEADNSSKPWNYRQEGSLFSTTKL